MQVLLGALFADLVAANRRLAEDVQYRLRRLEYRSGGAVESVEGACAELLRLEPAGHSQSDGDVPSRLPR